MYRILDVHKSIISIAKGLLDIVYGIGYSQRDLRQITNHAGKQLIDRRIFCSGIRTDIQIVQPLHITVQLRFQVRPVRKASIHFVTCVKQRLDGLFHIIDHGIDIVSHFRRRGDIDRMPGDLRVSFRHHRSGIIHIAYQNGCIRREDCAAAA